MNILVILYGLDLIVHLANVVEKVIDVRNSWLVKRRISSEKVNGVGKSVGWIGHGHEAIKEGSGEGGLKDPFKEI